MTKRIILFGILLLGLLMLSMLVNYFTLHSVQPQVAPLATVAVDEHAIERLSRAIQIPTVSTQFDPEDFIAYLQQAFPLVHQQLTLKRINGAGLVYHWSTPATLGKPMLWSAHYDVVPAPDSGWEQPPFSGWIDEQYVWGRGSLDDKSSLMAMLEAVELLLRANYQPGRDVYLAFGQDEEVGGQQGAAQIARYFTEQQLQFDYVLDEGLVITDGILPFVDQPVALIGIAEKGYADIELSLQGPAGHASMPGQHTLLGDLSRAIERIQDEPLSAEITPPVQQMLMALAPQSHTLARLSFSNLWLFRPLVMRQFAQSPATHAAINTTFAPTQMFASDAPNVLPDRVSAIINVRMLPGTTAAQVVAHIRRVIDDTRVLVRVVQASEASGIASTGAQAYQQLSRSIRQVFPNTLVAPGLVIPATDSRHYQHLALQSYRFLPIKIRKGDLTRFHGRDERIAKSAYEDMIRFYYQFLVNNGAATAPKL